MKPAHILSFTIAGAACLIATLSIAAGRSGDEASPIYGVRIPAGYREWQVIAPSQEAGKLDELRVILGNPIAMKAFRKGTLPFPDGTILAKLAWKRAPSMGDDGALGAPQAFVPAAATTAQFMIKDSKRYAASGGWGLAGSSTANPSTERSTKPASPATKPMHKATIWSSRNTHRIEGTSGRRADPWRRHVTAAEAPDIGLILNQVAILECETPIAFG